MVLWFGRRGDDKGKDSQQGFGHTEKIDTHAVGGDTEDDAGTNGERSRENGEPMEPLRSGRSPPELAVREAEILQLRLQNQKLIRQNQKLQERFSGEVSSVNKQASAFEQAAGSAEQSWELRQLQMKFNRLQEQRFAEVEELVHIRWVNACLRHELRKARKITSPNKGSPKSSPHSPSPFDQGAFGNLTALELLNKPSRDNQKIGTMLMRRYAMEDAVAASFSVLSQARGKAEEAAVTPGKTEERIPEQYTISEVRQQAMAAASVDQSEGFSQEADRPRADPRKNADYADVVLSSYSLSVNTTKPKGMGLSRGLSSTLGMLRKVSGGKRAPGAHKALLPPTEHFGGSHYSAAAGSERVTSAPLLPAEAAQPCLVPEGVVPSRGHTPLGSPRGGEDAESLPKQQHLPDASVHSTPSFPGMHGLPPRPPPNTPTPKPQATRQADTSLLACSRQASADMSPAMTTSQDAVKRRRRTPSRPPVSSLRDPPEPDTPAVTMAGPGCPPPPPPPPAPPPTPPPPPGSLRASHQPNGIGGIGRDQSVIETYQQIV
ncbi:hypothetical protein CYMTET_52891, partial [Cymbomonas tetramitiformis]